MPALERSSLQRMCSTPSAPLAVVTIRLGIGPGFVVPPTKRVPTELIRAFSVGAEFKVVEVENVNIPVGYCAFVLAPKIQEITADEYWFVLAPVIAAKFNCAVLLVVVAALVMVIEAVLPFNVVLVSDF